MDNYSDETYGERIADIYDQWYASFDPAAVNFLAKLARGGNALELGIGTGRIAVPLLQAGVAIHGVDISESMVAKLRAKHGGEKIPVSMGNFADVPIDGKFNLIYVVFNTIFSLLTQEDQVRCFQNVAGHLVPDGVFVIEAFVPDMSRFTAGQAMRVNHVGDDLVQIDVSELEMDRQVISSQHLVLTEQGTRMYPVKLRFIWPSEMDLMAQLSQMRLRKRWSDWNKSEFTSESTKHISVYERWNK